MRPTVCRGKHVFQKRVGGASRTLTRACPRPEVRRTVHTVVTLSPADAVSNSLTPEAEARAGWPLGRRYRKALLPTGQAARLRSKYARAAKILNS